MNIREAKEELKYTIRSYTEKDKNGNYRLPRIRQRPILLIGPPGIGKTAIMEQAARECGVGLVSYTITHHTRQSAVGLPLVEEKNYGGRTYTVTEYTMSEIIASIYEYMEATGQQEGILFIDEINCVSETLAPTMLAFLQCKTFGGHKVPDGWVIAAAGNPREYNKSVREFDIVTLDRVRKIQIHEDLEAWREYALGAGIHHRILSYLYLKPENFYHISQNALGKEFVTARGWEDLSCMLEEYERLGVKITQDFVGEFLQAEEIARDFTSYYQLAGAYEKELEPKKILNGSWRKEGLRKMTEKLQRESADAKFCIVQWLASRTTKLMKKYEKDREWKKELERMIVLLEDYWKLQKSKRTCTWEIAQEFLERRKHSQKVLSEAGVLSEDQLLLEEAILQELESWPYLWKENHVHTWEAGRQLLLEKAASLDGFIEKCVQEIEAAINNSLEFLEDVLRESSWLVLYLGAVFKCPQGKIYLGENPQSNCKKYAGLFQISQEEEEIRRILPK